MIFNYFLLEFSKMVNQWYILAYLFSLMLLKFFLSNWGQNDKLGS